MVWLKFQLGDRDYRVTLDRLSIAEAREVKRYTGVTLNALVMVSAGQVDGDVLAAVVFLAKRRAGEEIDWSEIDQIDVVTLMSGMSYAEGDETGPSSPDTTPAAAAANGAKPARRTAKTSPTTPSDQEPAATS